MASLNVVDLSFAPGEQQSLGDLPFEAGMPEDQQPEDVKELIVSHADVVLLTAAPDAPIQAVVRFVTTLRASHNSISSLSGLEAFPSLEVLDLSYNAIRVVDAHAAGLLKSLKRLRTIDFSHNNMSLLDLDGAVGSPTPRMGGQGSAAGSLGTSSALAGAAAAGLPSLTAINLSHNLFIELPDLRSAPFLQVLNCSHNKLAALTDMDARLPLLALHSLLLHANRLPSVSALVPLCALAATLKHIQVYDNPFTLSSGAAAEAELDETLWWRPFLLWLCPLLATVDQAEFSASERRTATEMLFRENGKLSRSLLEHMNPQHKEGLETYLKQRGRAVEPPQDAVAVIRELQEEDAQESSMAAEGYAVGASAFLGEEDKEEEDEGYGGAVVVPMSRMNTVRERSSLGSIRWGDGFESHRNGSPSNGYFADTQENDATADGPSFSPRGSQRVVIIDPQESTAKNATDSILLTNHNRQRSKTVPVAAVVRALQQKTRSLEEVVAVLWRSDVARRTAAAVVIQRHIRGALARMHLSRDDAECCRFIRDQLTQAAAAAKAQRTTNAAMMSASGASRGPSVRAAAMHSTRQPSIEPMEANGSNIEDVLVSMRSLQEVMSSMWVDLEEYRAMADREQRRAATLIQRWYRGYRVRRDYGRVTRAATAPSRGSVSQSCKCAGKTAALQREVLELRHEVRELRELLTQSARQQRLASYVDPEKAMDAIVEKHEQRVSARQQSRDTKPVRLDDSRSPSATPSFTAGEAASQERGAFSTPHRDVLGDGAVRRNEVIETPSSSPSQVKSQLHRPPQQLSSRASASDGASSEKSSPVSNRFPKITKRRPRDLSKVAAGSPNGGITHMD